MNINKYNFSGFIWGPAKKLTNEILIFSTGIVGEHLPIDKMIEKIDKTEFKFKSSWDDAASAIMTTDKFKKIIKKSFVFLRMRAQIL